MTKPAPENKILAALKWLGMGIIHVIWSILKGIFQLLMIFVESNQEWQTETHLQEEDEKESMLKLGPKNVKMVLAIVAVVIKADGKTDPSELAYVEKRFGKEYSSRTAKLWMVVLVKELERTQDLKKLCRKAEIHFSQSTKIQLLHLLCGTVTRDGMLTTKEFETLKEISMRLRLPFKTFKSILALFDYITEEESKRRKEQKSARKQTPKWYLKRAYIILEIKYSASDGEVKRAFRKLAKIHHPDKVIHMGESFQKAANKKFKEILDAYELIKEERGIS